MCGLQNKIIVKEALCINGYKPKFIFFNDIKSIAIFVISLIESLFFTSQPIYHISTPLKSIHWVKFSRKNYLSFTEQTNFCIFNLYTPQKLLHQQFFKIFLTIKFCFWYNLFTNLKVIRISYTFFDTKNARVDYFCVFQNLQRIVTSHVTNEEVARLIALIENDRSQRYVAGVKGV